MPRRAGEDELVRAPAPFDHIVASPVLSVRWGRGWLGYTIAGDQMEVWFIYADLSGSELVEHTTIKSYNDRRRSQVWIMFRDDTQQRTSDDRWAVFLLHPSEDQVVFTMPRPIEQEMML